MSSGSTGPCRMSPTVRRYLSVYIVWVDLYRTSCFPSAFRMIKLMNIACGYVESPRPHQLCALWWGQNLPLPLQIEEISSTGVLEIFFYQADSIQAAPVATDVPIVLEDGVCFCCCPSQEAGFYRCCYLGQCSPPPPVMWQKEGGQQPFPVLIHSNKWFVSDLYHITLMKRCRDVLYNISMQAAGTV